MLWQIYKRLFSFPVLLQLDNGMFYLADPAAGNSTGVIYTRIYESIYIEFLRRNVVRGGVGIDVGAHTGLYTLLLGGCCSSMVCFEPDPETLALLSRNLCLNGLTACAIQSAVSDQSGNLMLKRTGRYSGTTRLLIEGETDTNSELLEVKVHTIDEVTKEMGIANLTFLKIDTEGNELNVLLGARTILSESPDCIVVYENSHLSSISEFFTELGWVVFGIDRSQNLLIDYPQIRNAYNLFACGPSHPLFYEVNHLKQSHNHHVGSSQY